MVLDTYTANIVSKKIKIKDIPKKLTMSSWKKNFQLEGFVSYNMPRKSERRKNKSKGNEENENLDENLILQSSRILHYTAVHLHGNGQWTEIDDIDASEKVFKHKYVVPHLLIYSEIKNC